MMANYIGFAIFILNALIDFWGGILSLMGKQDSFLKKYDAELYDMKRVRLLTALQEFDGAICSVVLAFTDKTMVAGLTVGLGLLTFVVLFALKRTWTKKVNFCRK